MHRFSEGFFRSKGIQFSVIAGRGWSHNSRNEHDLNVIRTPVALVLRAGVQICTRAARRKAWNARARFVLFLFVFILYAYGCSMAKLVCVRY